MDIIVKVMFKIVWYGVIILYVMSKIFFVINIGGKFIIYYGDNVYYINIVLEFNKWN